MVTIDWDSETSKPPGIYHVEVVSSTEARGNQSGEPYFMVTFNDVAGGDTICSDVISFSPKALHMSISKLKALGFAKGKKNLDAEELVGRRCHIAAKVEDDPKYGPRLVVDISAPGFRVGYRSESEKVPTEITAAEVDSDLPF